MWFSGFCYVHRVVPQLLQTFTPKQLHTRMCPLLILPAAPQPLAVTDMLAFSLNSLTLGVHSRSHTACGLFCRRVPWSVTPSRFSHVRACVSALFFVLLSNGHCVGIRSHQLVVTRVISLLVAVNTHTSFCVDLCFISPGYLPRSDLLRQLCNWAVSHQRSCQAACFRGHSHLH